ncbi:hypothetical protein KL86DPRO_20593 [uncultured delta proteobacterium]|uniref:Uncharacterized protein n=1 Tax=uncultured delta proteobacterium TaxID=34034 RepID=A0A212K2Y6_9DELT|nr:hypothetical protein KL86DPRO_20593 [uncultured delta proteobacterium]
MAKKARLASRASRAFFAGFVDYQPPCGSPDKKPYSGKIGGSKILDRGDLFFIAFLLKEL